MRPNSLLRILAGCLALAPSLLSAQQDAPKPAFWSWALTPPMGWNSYPCWGTSITEEETLANARYMQEHLLPHGWKYLVIDARWYDPESPINDRDFKNRIGVKLDADEFGRMHPSLNRFPSAAHGAGFKPLADKLHAMGLKFGFHMMRGIPRQAVNAKTPIEGSTFTAADAGDPTNTCSWCPDMFGVRANQAGQAWYDAMIRLYAAWGLDFIKVDDLSNPYYDAEVEMIRRAIDKCGRPIVLSASAGPTPITAADHVKLHTNMWRISADFWDRWKDLNHQFELLDQWRGATGPGHFADADIIPLGHIGIRSRIAGDDRQTRLTKDEQVTLMTLWALAPSPLMLGMHLPDLDAWTLTLLTNDEVLAVNQDTLIGVAKRAVQKDGTEVWTKDLKDGSKAIGLFNRGPADIEVTLLRTETGLQGNQTLRDLWTRRDLGPLAEKFSTTVPSHGAILLRVIPTK